MRLYARSAILAFAVTAALSGGAAQSRPSDATAETPALPPFRVSLLGTYATNIYDQGAAEIVAHDPLTQRLFVVNGASGSIDILAIANPATPVLSATLPLSPTYGVAANSVAVSNGIVAAAVEAQTKTDPGKAVFFNTDGTFVSQVTIGALPDMITFTPDGTKVLVANEGEPNSYGLPDSVDPEGSVSIVDLSGGAASPTVANVSFAEFNVGGPRAAELPAGVRIFGPGASVAQDLEPEYIAVSPDSSTAYVTLQENNALAIIDIATARVTAIRALGAKDHRAEGNGLDTSDRDGPGATAAISITTAPVLGMYQPDAIAAYRAAGQTLLVTANEGDARDYDGFAEEIRVGNAGYLLDPAMFTDSVALKNNARLGRLTVTTASGNTDADPEYEAIYAFGARSFSIWNAATGALVFDSADAFERITAETFPEFFNSDNAENGSFDSRSDNKGPEPEGVTLGEIAGRTYAFVGLERIGGVMVFDISTPAEAQFIQYINPRDWSGDAEAGTAGDLGPEGLEFVPAAESATGQPLLLVANEVSGSTSIFQLDSLRTYLPAVVK